MRVSHDDIARQNQRRAHELVEALICGGVRDAVISPGSRNTPLVLAFAEAARQQDSMAIHTVLDERSAAFYALGLSRAGGTPAVLCCTSGSAGGHYLPAIAEAASSGVPMVVITADRPVELQDCGAPQTMNQDRLYGEHVRYYRNLGLPDLRTEDTGFASTAVACALDRAQGMRPGPVHLNQPFRKPLWRELERGDEMAPVRRAKISRGRLEPSGDMIPYLVWRMDESPRGVIVCGPNPGGLGGSALSESHGFSEALLCLADSLGWPILADPLSSLRYGGHRHAAIISTYDAFLADSDVAQALAPQLILHFGRQPTSTALVQWMAQCEQAHTVLVEPSGDWHDPTHCASELLAVDPERLCHHLCERLGDEPPADPHWIGRWQQLETTTRACLNSACEEGLWSGFIASTVVGALPNIGGPAPGP